jgi:hypothetical protein
LRPNYSWVVTDTHVFSPTLVNTFSTGGNRDAMYDQVEVDGFQPASGAELVKSLGLQGVNQANVSNPGGSPVFDIAGYDTVEIDPGGKYLDSLNYNFADNVSWAFGRHVLKFGGELRTYSRFNAQVPNENFGSFEFDGAFTNDAYADFLLGLPLSSTRLNPIVDRKLTSKELGLFITDTFKATSKLTLDFGLRWDRFSATTYDDGLMFNWDPATGNVIVPNDAMSRISPNYPSSINIVAGEVVPNPDARNFVPRIGAAYRLSNKTVIRGGYGMFNEFLGKFTRYQGGGPFAVTETYYNSIENGVPLYQMPDPFPSAGVSPDVPSQSVTAVPMQTKNGYIHQYNLSMEQQVGDMGFRVSYIGSRNRGVNYSIATNKPAPSLIPFSSDRRPWPQFVGTTQYRTDGGANYDSLSVEASRRVGQLMFDNHYTWAHGMSNTLNLQNPYAPLYWNRQFLAKHRLVFNVVWDLPFGSGRRYMSNAGGVANQILGGWRAVWVAYFQSGQYFSPSFSGSDPSNTNTFGGFPDRICNGNMDPSQRTVEHWFDQTCFAVPPAGRFGNSGASVLEGPGLQVHNLTVSKKFRITERVNFDFMAVMSNIFNHPNFFAPAANISRPGEVGVISETHGLYSGERAGPRMVEVRGRISF